MTIILSPLEEDLLSIQHWSSGRIIAASSGTLEADLDRMIRSLVAGDAEFLTKVEKLLLESKKYPSSIKVKPELAERLMNRMVPGLADREEPIVAFAPPAEMRLVRRKGKVAAEELRAIAPVRNLHLAPVVGDDINRARVLAATHFWAHGNGRDDLAIIGGWSDARGGEIVTATGKYTPERYIRACMAAGAPEPDIRHEDYRVASEDRSKVVTITRGARRTA